MIVDSEKYSVVTRVVGYATSQVRLAASGNAALEHTEKCIRTENGKIVFGLAVRPQAPTIEKLGVWRDGICPGVRPRRYRNRLDTPRQLCRNSQNGWSQRHLKNRPLRGHAIHTVRHAQAECLVPVQVAPGPSVEPARNPDAFGYPAGCKRPYLAAAPLRR